MGLVIAAPGRFRICAPWFGNDQAKTKNFLEMFLDRERTACETLPAFENPISWEVYHSKQKPTLLAANRPQGSGQRRSFDPKRFLPLMQPFAGRAMRRLGSEPYPWEKGHIDGF